MRKTKLKLSALERTAPNELSLTNNKDVVIQNADKGSTIVIQNRTNYISEGLTHLCDTNTYTLLTETQQNIYVEK